MKLISPMTTVPGAVTNTNVVLIIEGSSTYQSRGNLLTRSVKIIKPTVKCCSYITNTMISCIFISTITSVVVLLTGICLDYYAKEEATSALGRRMILGGTLALGSSAILNVPLLAILLCIKNR